MRIIDSNLNRICEGLRVIEDSLRFTFNSEFFSKNVKELRHKVRNSYISFDNELLGSRDVSGDIGPKITSELKLSRQKTTISLICANFKRVQEGLRTLEELTKTTYTNIDYTIFELARYQSYSLEKDIISYILRNDFKLPEIYGITYLEHSLGRSNIEIVKEMISAGIKLIQYREKTLSLREQYLECLEIRKLTKMSNVTFIINDHIDIALLVNADGIHIGQDDIPIKEARKILGVEKIIGVSTHSPEQANKAVIDGADYIGVGPIFTTKTKVNVCDPVGFTYLEWVGENIKIPYVAIGGIKEHNIREIVKRGSKSIALVSEITANENIKNKVHCLLKIIRENNNDI